MTEAELRFFIEVTTAYFTQVSGEAAQMGIPYVKKAEPAVLDYTGLIGVSGPRRGALYFTAGRELLATLTRDILEEEATDEETLLDLVGELTNTVAGNVRRNFGPEFLISVPMLLKGRPDDIQLRLTPPVYVIPLTWKREKALLVVGLE